jgi:hypothetical protein
MRLISTLVTGLILASVAGRPAAASCRAPAGISARKWVYVRLEDKAAKKQGARMVYSSKQEDLLIAAPTHVPPQAYDAGDDCFYIEPTEALLFVALESEGFSRKVTQVVQPKQQVLAHLFLYQTVPLSVISSLKPVPIRIELGDTAGAVAKEWNIPAELLADYYGNFVAGKSIDIPFSKVYTIRPGDSPSSVSKLFKVKPEVLWSFDPKQPEAPPRVGTAGVLVPGKQLAIPNAEPADRRLLESLSDKLKASDSVVLKRISSSEIVVYQRKPELGTETPALGDYESKGVWYLFPAEGIEPKKNKLLLGSSLGSIAKPARVSITPCESDCPKPFAAALVGFHSN